MEGVEIHRLASRAESIIRSLVVQANNEGEGIDSSILGTNCTEAADICFNHGIDKVRGTQSNDSGKEMSANESEPD